jgi:hypothetical protein
VLVRNPLTGEVKATLKNIPADTHGIALSHDGKYLATWRMTGSSIVSAINRPLPPRPSAAKEISIRLHEIADGQPVGQPLKLEAGRGDQKNSAKSGSRRWRSI